MANSFLPNNEDISTQAPGAENTSLTAEVLKMHAPPKETNIESIPEVPMPTDSLEGHPDTDEHFLEENNETTELSAPTPFVAIQANNKQSPTKPIPQVRPDLSVQIEKIMEENLGDVYSVLTPVQKQQFKIKGEETVEKIRHIIENSKAKLGKIIRLIFDWLKILPGINHFFLEQEAKIKAEKIIALSNQKKHIQ